jgi:hypothetical protein
MVHEVSGATSAIILPQAYSDQKLAGGSTLVMEKEAGESVVSSLKLANIGVALEFHSTKAMAPPEAAALGPIANSQPGK